MESKLEPKNHCIILKFITNYMECTLLQKKQSLALTANVTQKTQNFVECVALFQSKYFFSTFLVFLEKFFYIRYNRKKSFFLQNHVPLQDFHRVQFHKQDQLAQIFHKQFLFIDIFVKRVLLEIKIKQVTCLRPFLVVIGNSLMEFSLQVNQNKMQFLHLIYFQPTSYPPRH